MATKKITPSLRREILQKAAEGHSARDIAAWLKKDRAVTISHQAVGNALRETKTERAEVAKAVTREVLARTIVGDLTHLDELLTDLRDTRQRAKKALDAWVLEGKRQREEAGGDAAPARAKKRVALVPKTGKGGRRDDEAGGEDAGGEVPVEEALAFGNLYEKVAKIEVAALKQRLDLAGAGDGGGEDKGPNVHVLLPDEDGE